MMRNLIQTVSGDDDAGLKVHDEQVAKRAARSMTALANGTSPIGYVILRGPSQCLAP